MTCATQLEQNTAFMWSYSLCAEQSRETLVSVGTLNFWKPSTIQVLRIDHAPRDTIPELMRNFLVEERETTFAFKPLSVSQHFISRKLELCDCIYRADFQAG